VNIDNIDKPVRTRHLPASYFAVYTCKIKISSVIGMLAHELQSKKKQVMLQTVKD